MNKILIYTFFILLKNSNRHYSRAEICELSPIFRNVYHIISDIPYTRSTLIVNYKPIIQQYYEEYEDEPVIFMQKVNELMNMRVYRKIASSYSR